MTIQWAILGLGVLVGVLGVALWFTARERYTVTSSDATLTHNRGLIRQDSDSAMPEHSSPGMIGTLDDGFVSAHDILISIVDLAARGWLGIWRTGNDWTFHALRHVPSATDVAQAAVADAAPGTGDPLLPAEDALLDALFHDSEMLTLDKFFAETQVYDEALTQLQFAADDTGWFTEPTHSRWGLVGAGFVALGLVFAGVSLVGGLPYIQWPGIIGAALTIGAGALVASLNKLRRDYTEAGDAARAHLERYHDWLSGMAAHDIPSDKLGETFNAHVAAALAFGMGADFAAVFTQATARLAAWGRPVALDVAWMNGASTPEQCLAAAGRFIDDGTALATELGL
jgi:hypothetical protein